MLMKVSLNSGRKEDYQPLLMGIGSLLIFLSIMLIKPLTDFIRNCEELLDAISDLVVAATKLVRVWQEFLKQIKNRR
ncbi:hypothetical protein GKC33_14645 (plasmid) [Lactobacillus salivarius]|uniref:Uncharacterized protein n=1 Tax=Ligilactobacillus salivarius TaxID=1624 RepID=A0A6A8LZ72_9LACO|nr:hypothetical protein [Ligilactobacillus salivarius]MSE07089.1 hypothetical protein [Ligilactobacillus salivarius]MSE07416.1 hypothetical protein [Ligilactobacillus salivarius]MSE09846.1 hypothetical protein [Ligilactobacillus salivarius]